MVISGGTQEELATTAKNLSFTDDNGEDMHFSFMRVIPRPESESENWYHWNIANWGVKWDVSNSRFERSESELVYFFDTAWSAPLGVMSALVKQFPQHEFVFTFEEEQGWGGVMQRGEDGNLVTVREWEIPDTHAEIIKRGGDCYCDENQQFYPDCFAERARTLDSITDRVREAVVSLAKGWEGSFAELVQAATSLSTEKSNTPN